MGVYFRSPINNRTELSGRAVRAERQQTTLAGWLLNRSCGVNDQALNHGRHPHVEMVDHDCIMLEILNGAGNSTKAVSHCLSNLQYKSWGGQPARLQDRC